MTDRELLELAAKAAGFKRWNFKSWPDFMNVYYGNDDIDEEWNPLYDDADALRLAVKLRMDIEQSVPQDQSLWVCASVAESGVEGRTLCFEDESQRLIATRRAIVLVAAGIAIEQATQDQNS